MLTLELIYAAADKSLLRFHRELPEGATVADLLQACCLWQTHPETRDLSLGIFSHPVTLDTLLKTGDRVEVYRPLLLDPKERRRQRAGKRRQG